MGASVSTSAVKAIQKSIAEVVISNTANCQTTSDQTQDIVVHNKGFSFWSSAKFSQKSKVDVSCLNDAKLQADLQQKIFEIIKNYSAADNISVLNAFGTTATTALTNLENEIKASVRMDNIVDMVNRVQNTQNITFINEGNWIISDLSATQGAEIVASATIQSMADAGIFNKIESYVDQRASNTSWTYYLIVFIAIIVAVFAGGAGLYFLLKKRGDTDINN